MIESKKTSNSGLNDTNQPKITSKAKIVKYKDLALKFQT